MIVTSAQLRLLHVSDVHATESGALYGEIDTLSRLADVAEYARAQELNVDGVVITGDLIQRGNQGAYPRVDEACRNIEATLGVPVMTVLGNHDDPEAATKLRGHEAGHTGVTQVCGTRIVRLNSQTRELGEEQLDWLSDLLSTPSERGTVIALHHPPAASHMPVLRKQGLRDARAFMRVIDGSDVRAVLTGHFHHSQSAVIRGIPVFTAPALSYHQVMHAGPTHVSGHNAAWFSLVQLSPHGVQSTPIELSPGAPVFTQVATGA